MTDKYSVGDLIKITRSSTGNWFSVGEVGRLIACDKDGDWWAKFESGEWCIGDNDPQSVWGFEPYPSKKFSELSEATKESIVSCNAYHPQLYGRLSGAGLALKCSFNGWVETQRMMGNEPNAQTQWLVEMVKRFIDELERCHADESLMREYLWEHITNGVKYEPAE